MEHFHAQSEQLQCAGGGDKQEKQWLDKGLLGEKLNQLQVFPWESEWLQWLTTRHSKTQVEPCLEKWNYKDSEEEEGFLLIC